MSDPFNSIIAPLPISEAIWKALGVALRLAPTIATVNYLVYITWEVMSREWVEKFINTSGVQWIMHQIWLPRWVVKLASTSVILLICYIAWFWFWLLVKHVQICLLGTLPCGPCPVTVQSLLLPAESLLLSFCLLRIFIENIYSDVKTMTDLSLGRHLTMIREGKTSPAGNIVGISARVAATANENAAVDAAGSGATNVGCGGDADQIRLKTC